jgi:acid phosphatase family membrane protein YuiD
LVWARIGLGDLPSTHTAVVSSTAALVGLREGVNTAVFSMATALAMIVMLDALHVRREVGAHAAALNHVLKDDPLRKRFREAVGHRHVDVRSGLPLGLICAVALRVVLPYRHRVHCRTHLRCCHPFSRLVSHHF